MPPRKPISAKLRVKVALRANHLCEYCKAPKAYSPSPFDTEHIIPLSLEGRSVFENLAFSCHGCNGHKYNKTDGLDPIEDILAPLFNPRTDSWRDHFAWDDEGSLIIGMTPIGRVTVELLKLNRQELINLRKILMVVGMHPPRD